MEKSEGIHFYVNVENFNDVVLNEEQHTGKVNHSIHALELSLRVSNIMEKQIFQKVLWSKRLLALDYTCML